MAEKKKRVNGKSKGSGFERLIAKLLTSWSGELFSKVPASGGLRWGKDHRVAGDIVPPVDSEFPFCIECKKHEGWLMDDLIKGTGNIVKWWNQCTRDADNIEKTPLLVFSRNRAPIFFMVRYEDFVKLCDNGSNFTTDYLITTLDKGDGELECVGVGIFDELLTFEKEYLYQLISE